MMGCLCHLQPFPDAVMRSWGACLANIITCHGPSTAWQPPAYTIIPTLFKLKGTCRGCLPCSNIVTPHDTQVMGASTPGPAAMIVDCPDVRFLPHLVSHADFAAWQLRPASGTGSDRSSPPGKQATVVIHLSPAEVWPSSSRGLRQVMGFGDTFAGAVAAACHCLGMRCCVGVLRRQWTRVCVTPADSDRQSGLAGRLQNMTLTMPCFLQHCLGPVRLLPCCLDGDPWLPLIQAVPALSLLQ